MAESCLRRRDGGTIEHYETIARSRLNEDGGKTEDGEWTDAGLMMEKWQQ